MKSTMTEKEFRAKLRAGEMVPVHEYACLSDRAVALAREAGLEFAPEQVKLPERLMIGPLGPSGVWIGHNSGGETFSCRNEAARPLAEALADRYNAYSGLRAAAEDLRAALELRDVAGVTWHDNIRTAYLSLTAELAKGPK